MLSFDRPDLPVVTRCDPADRRTPAVARLLASLVPVQ
jgi:hypothetical protein